MKLKQIIHGTDAPGRDPHATVIASLLAHAEERVSVAPAGRKYRLVLGPLFDREAARKAGRRDAACVKALAVEGWGRFGNAVLQTANALAVAVHYRVKSVYLPGWWWLREGRYELAGGLRMVNRRGVALDDEEIIAVGRFFDLGPASGAATGGVSPAEALGWLREWLVVRPAGRALAESHLVTLTIVWEIQTTKLADPDPGTPLYNCCVFEVNDKYTIAGGDQEVEIVGKAIFVVFCDSNTGAIYAWIQQNPGPSSYEYTVGAIDVSITISRGSYFPRFENIAPPSIDICGVSCTYDVNVSWTANGAPNHAHKGGAFNHNVFRSRAQCD